MASMATDAGQDTSPPQPAPNGAVVVEVPTMGTINAGVGHLINQMPAEFDSDEASGNAGFDLGPLCQNLGVPAANREGRRGALAGRQNYCDLHEPPPKKLAGRG